MHLDCDACLIVFHCGENLVPSESRVRVEVRVRVSVKDPLLCFTRGSVEEGGVEGRVIVVTCAPYIGGRHLAKTVASHIAHVYTARTK